MRLQLGGKLLATCACALMLSACGGSDQGVASTPPPPVTPTPPPAIPATAASAPLGEPPSGVTTSTSLASIGIVSDVRWNATLHAYELTIDGVSGARVSPNPAANFGQTGTIVKPDGTTLGIRAWTGFSYTRYGSVYNLGGSVRDDFFAFGLPTPAGAVPVTGTASYQAQIDGGAYDASNNLRWDLGGTATFDFDFAAGTLSGKMTPELLTAWDTPPPLSHPVYQFTNTVFSQGSTTFSGSFDLAGPTPSSFQGQFTGPSAQELMASFMAPYFDASFNGWGQLRGVMAGKH